MTSNILNVTDASFDADVLQQSGLVLVDFWADWCGPCKALSPVLTDLADEYQGEVRIVKINADDNPGSADRLAVRGLPSLLVFVDGVEKERLVGAMSKTRLAAMLDQHLGV